MTTPMSAVDTSEEKPMSAKAILDRLHMVREQMWQENQMLGDEAWLREINRPGGYEEYLKRQQAQKTP